VAHPRLLYAHRGAAAELPENTLASFERALTLGADALEMDAHLSLDGHVIISHDPSGERMCRRPEVIGETPLAELRHWDAGENFVDKSGNKSQAGKGHVLPTFDEVLESFPGTRINIDLKSGGRRMVGAAMRTISRHNADSLITLASFHATTMLFARAAGYRGRTSLASTEFAAALATPSALLRHLPLFANSAQIPTRALGIRLAHRRVIDKLHRAGLRVDFWTINDPAEAQQLLELGADGIMTDDPRAIAPVFGKAPVSKRNGN